MGKRHDESLPWARECAKVSQVVNQSITQPRTALQAIAQLQLIDAAREIGTVLIEKCRKLREHERIFL